MKQRYGPAVHTLLLAGLLSALGTRGAVGQNTSDGRTRLVVVAGSVHTSRGQELNDCGRDSWKFGLGIEAGHETVLKLDGAVFMSTRDRCVSGPKEVVWPSGLVTTRMGGRELTGPRVGVGLGRRMEWRETPTYLGIQAGFLRASNSRSWEEVTGNTQPWFGLEAEARMFRGRVGINVMQWWNKVSFQDLVHADANPYPTPLPEQFTSESWMPVTEVSVRVGLLRLF